jgi:hypothetical protein
MAASADPTGLWQVGSGQKRRSKIFLPRQNAARSVENSINARSVRATMPNQNLKPEMREPSRSRRDGLMIAPRDPFRVEVPIFAHEANFGTFAIGAKLLRGIDGKQHRLVLGLVRTKFIIAVLDHPFVLNLIANDEITGSRHGTLFVLVAGQAGNAEREGMFLTHRQTK